MHFSTGSGGKSTVWGRLSSDGIALVIRDLNLLIIFYYLKKEIPIAVRFEQIFYDSFRADEYSTLAVVVFPLGSWVGGLYTTLCVRYLCAKGYPITLATPGNNINEIIRVVQELSPLFQQTVILGYPPFIKTLIDAGIAQGVPWSSFNLKMIFAGEVFSEEWRALVASRSGIQDPLTSMVSIYGTADAGVLACETPLSARIRKWISSYPQLCLELFGKNRMPSLMQYDPNVRYMEIDKNEGTLAFTTIPCTFASQCKMSDTITAPLIRYSIGDAGGLLSFENMMQFIKTKSSALSISFDPIAETLNTTHDRGCRPSPFVFVFGRAFWSVSLYGANVWVDQVMVGLERPHINQQVTGKFVLATTNDDLGDTRLHVIVELAPNVTRNDNLILSISESIMEELKRVNSEFCNYVSSCTLTQIVH